MAKKKMPTSFIEGTTDVELQEDYVVETSLGSITIPKGFISDGASVPKPLWGIVSPYDPEVRDAALIHDYFYRTPGARLVSSDKVTNVYVSRKMADEIFLEELKDNGTSFFLRYSMYWTVRGWNYFTDNWKE